MTSSVARAFHFSHGWPDRDVSRRDALEHQPLYTQRPVVAGPLLGLVPVEGHRRQLQRRPPVDTELLEQRPPDRPRPRTDVDPIDREDIEGDVAGGRRPDLLSDLRC